MDLPKRKTHKKETSSSMNPDHPSHNRCSSPRAMSMMTWRIMKTALRGLLLVVVLRLLVLPRRTWRPARGPPRMMGSMLHQQHPRTSSSQTTTRTRNGQCASSIPAGFSTRLSWFINLPFVFFFFFSHMLCTHRSILFVRKCTEVFPPFVTKEKQFGVKKHIPCQEMIADG